jgi:hypothetical protein
MKNESGWTDTVSTARQRQYMQPLPAGQGVKQNGETFYADPDTIHHQVYTGYRVHYQAYKQAQLLASRQNPALNVHPDPHGVVVNEFDGRSPALLLRSMAIKRQNSRAASSTLLAAPSMQL